MSVQPSEVAPNVLIGSSHNFSANLFNVLHEEHAGENIFVSPISIHLILILTWLGSKGKTAAELKSGLYLPSDENSLLDSVQQLVTSLEKPQLHSVNEIFIDQQFSVKQEFIDKGKQHFKSGVQLVPFRNDSVSAVNTVNNFVLNKTNNKIPDFLSPQDIDSLTRLILVNAIHFKDSWRNPFPDYNTLNQTFYLSKEKSVDVPFIRLYGKSFKFFSGDTYKALELPYQGDEFKMLILLPTEVDGLPALQNKLRGTCITEITEKMSRKGVSVEIPKFKLEVSYDLKKILSKLGMSDMFGKTADFSGINNETELSVTKAIHKSFIEVNEVGTEAAAATGVIIGERTAHVSTTPPEIFQADHPFSFYILYGNVILFAGTILKL